MSEISWSRRLRDLFFFMASMVTLVGSFGFYMWRTAPPPQKGGKGKGFRFAVRVEPAKRGNIRESVLLTGDLTPVRQVTLHSEIVGIVLRLGGREGDVIRQGAPVAYLDNTDQRLLVAKQEAMLKQAEAAHERAKALYARDSDQYKRAAQLRKSDSVAESEMIQSRFQREASKAAVAESLAQIALRKAELSAAKRDLGKTIIRAPFTGRLGRLYIERGKMVRPGDPVVDLVDSMGVEIRLFVPPRHIAQVAINQEVSISPVQAPHLTSAATIKRLLPQADASSRNREVIAYLKDPPSAFLPGLPVKARVTFSERKGVLIVRKDALIRLGNDWILFKIKDGLAKQVSVQIVNEEQDRVEVSGDIQPGDPIVTLGNEALFHNAPISLDDPFAPTKPKTASAEN
jgi:membrane fusion protein (multidrug efflux system)